MRPSLGAITDAVWFLGIQNQLVTPSSEQGETASNRGGTREPFLFYGPPLQCLPQRYIWGVATKKPAEEAGRVMGSLNITSNAATCSVDM